MSLWEYKHITSGPHGFATPALLESYLNQLGKDEWEIISYQTLPTNALAFNGIARRTTQRDWTLESAAAAAAKIEADKLRAEFAAKFQGNSASAPAAGAESVEKPASLVTDAAAPEDGFRKLRDTERDSDPDAHEGEDWDEWDNYDDDLPTFFEAIKPHLRKNQRGPGQSVGVTFLAKRWEQTEGDLVGALKECGFVVPETEDAPPEHLEFEGDLYWLNLNNRHELFINTREKPRPVYRTAQAKKLDPSDPAAALLAEEAAAEQNEKNRRDAERAAREAEQAARRAENEARRAAAQASREAAQAAAKASAELAANAAAASAPVSSEGGETGGATADHLNAAQANAGTPGVAPEVAAGPLPQGEELLAAIRPQMRRNRRGPGYSGSAAYLARALKHSEADIIAAFVALGLHMPENANEKPVKSTLGDFVYWLNKDSRGSLWINGDEVRGPKNGGAPAAPAASASSIEAGATVANATPDESVSAAPSEPVAPAVAAEAAAQPAVEAPAVAPMASAEPVAPAAESSPVGESKATGPEANDVAAAPTEAALAAIRLLMKANKRGSGVSGETGYLARALNQDHQDFLVALTRLGLALPDTEDDKPSFVESGDEIFWLNKNPKDGSVWVNAKASKASARKPAAKKSKKASAEE